MELEQIQQVALAAARNGGEVLRSLFGKLETIEKKGPIDLVTQADRASEKAVIDTIYSVFPDHGILAEESGSAPGTQDFRWIIDPLDGTTNFAHGVPIVAVSIACWQGDEAVVAVVLNPISGELFTAVKNGGTYFNGRRIQVTTSKDVGECLLVTGFPYNLKQLEGPLMQRFSNCLMASRGVRRLGAAAIDLCYVACGRFDGFWEQNLKPWDTAAGMLIVQEAGGVVTDYGNNPFTPDSNEILATNGYIHEQMLTLMELTGTE